MSRACPDESISFLSSIGCHTDAVAAASRLTSQSVVLHAWIGWWCSNWQYNHLRTLEGLAQVVSSRVSLFS